MAETDFLCSNYSLQASEPLQGSAPKGQVWFLLEYNGVWERRALESSLISAEVKDKLFAYLQTIPDSKLLLIRAPQRLEKLPLQNTASIRQSLGITFYIVLAYENNPLLYHFNLNRYEDLLGMDLYGVVNGTADYQIHRTNEKLFLACTHGRRDRCCARSGSQIFEVLFRKAVLEGIGGNIWQCSHVGGHRFAANVLCFPHGIYYGRVGFDDVGSILNSYLANEFYPERARGRACFQQPVQAAEIYLYQKTGQKKLGDFKLVEANQTETNLWKVIFQKQSGKERIRMLIAVHLSDRMVYKSCNSPEQTQMVLYDLVDLHIDTPEGG